VLSRSVLTVRDAGHATARRSQSLEVIQCRPGSTPTQRKVVLFGATVITMSLDGHRAVAVLDATCVVAQRIASVGTECRLVEIEVDGRHGVTRAAASRSVNAGAVGAFFTRRAISVHDAFSFQLAGSLAADLVGSALGITEALGATFLVTTFFSADAICFGLAPARDLLTRAADAMLTFGRTMRILTALSTLAVEAVFVLLSTVVVIVAVRVIWTTSSEGRDEKEANQECEV